MDKKKLSYVNNMWLGFEMINNNFIKMRNNGKIILYILFQKNILEREYAEGIKQLYNSYYNNIKKNNNINYTLDNAIDNLLNEINNESNFHLKNIENIEEQILKPFENLLENQLNKGLELSEKIHFVQKKFQKIYENLESMKLKFHSAAKTTEVKFTKFEKIKYYIEKENIDISFSNSTIDNKFSKSENNLAIPLQMKMRQLSEEQLKLYFKYDEAKNKNLIFAKELEKKYKDFIIEANQERENFINELTNIYNSFQEMDEKYINELKNYFLNITKYQIELYSKKLEIKNKEINEYNSININSDIELFINENKTSYTLPIEFKFESYNSQIKFRDSMDEKIKEKYEIGKRVSTLMNDIFKYTPQEYINNPEIEINFKKIEKNIRNIWKGKNYERDFLFSLFDKNIYRMHFLKCLNHFRDEGLFYLEENSFNNLCLILNFMLTKSNEENDYECIKLCIILSQTFFLEKEKNILIQDIIQKNPIWQHKKIWEGLIKYSIDSDINNPNNYCNLFNETKESRNNRIHSAAYGNLFTFWYNMKIFEVPIEKCKSVIKKFCKKYNMNENDFYNCDIPVKEVKTNIVINSIDDSIEKNDIKDLSEIDKKNNNSI